MSANTGEREYKCYLNGTNRLTSKKDNHSRALEEESVRTTEDVLCLESGT